MAKKYVSLGQLSISLELLNFVNNELLPGTGVKKKIFWNGLDKYVHELAPINKKLLNNRDEKKEKTEWHRVVVFNEGLVNVVQQYLKKGAQVYIEGQLSTRKWKDEKSGQDKYSTEVLIQGFNSSLTMLGGGGANNPKESFSSQDKKQSDEISQTSSDLDDEIPF